MMKLMHFSLFLQLIWPILFFSNYSAELDELFPITVCVVSCLVIFCNLFIIFPSNLHDISVISNIEMMKDEQIVNEVINEKRYAVDHIFCKFYRLIKSLKRTIDRVEMNGKVSNFFNSQSSNDHNEQNDIQFSELLIKFIHDSKSYITKKEDPTESLTIKSLIQLVK